MNENIKMVLLATVLSFVIPSFVVANKWGAQQEMQEQILQLLSTMDNKLGDTRDRVMRLEGRINIKD